MNEPKENLIADAVVDAVRKHLPYGTVDNVYWGAMWQEIRREARSHLSAALAATEAENKVLREQNFAMNTTIAAAQEREAKLREALEKADGMLKSLGQMDLHCVTLRTISGIREQIRPALSQPGQPAGMGQAGVPEGWINPAEYLPHLGQEVQIKTIRDEILTVWRQDDDAWWLRHHERELPFSYAEAWRPIDSPSGKEGV